MNIKSITKFGVVCFCMLFLDGAFVEGETLPSARFPYLVESLDVEEPLEFCGEPVPLQIQEVRERLEKELLLTFMGPSSGHSLAEAFRSPYALH